MRKELFWEYDLEQMAMDKNIKTIVTRVIERGTYDDWKEILKYYGDNKVINTLLQVRYLSNKSLNFASFIFDIPAEKFRCYTEKQLNQQHWNY